MEAMRKLLDMLEDDDIKHVIVPKYQKDDEAVKTLMEWVCLALLDKLQVDDYMKGDKTAVDYWKSLRNKKPAKESLDELITAIMDESDQEAFSMLKKGDKTWQAKNYYRHQVKGRDEDKNPKRAKLVKALESIVEMLDE